MDLDAPTTPPNSTAGEANDPTPVSRAQLHALLQQAEGAYGSAEAAVIFLMHKYQFSFDDLRHALSDEQLDVRFSKAKYSEIAMFYNLNPRYHMWDADRFHLKRARIPTDVFQRIVSDINQMLQVYKPPELHGIEDARSRFLAPLWHHIVAKFGMLIRNTPETMIQGRITTQGRIEYQFRSFDSLIVLFIELKMFVGDLNERMNAIAQVLAEGDACDYDNFQQGFNLPVYGILSDGSSWMFFRFNRTLQVARGVIPAEGDRQYLEYSIPPFQSTKTVEYVRSLRPACEYIYSIILTRFVNSIGAFYDQSIRRHSKRSSTPQWLNSRTAARNALEKALLAAREAEAIRLVEVKISVNRIVSPRMHGQRWTIASGLHVPLDRMSITSLSMIIPWLISTAHSFLCRRWVLGSEEFIVEFFLVYFFGWWDIGCWATVLIERRWCFTFRLFVISLFSYVLRPRHRIIVPCMHLIHKD
ncbi:hypothetical protein BDD12DRAFT_750529 [Trichophaea hybrida]|nr:hypothetical protein BDD12DRAFT_750529 [Trichophaea hybrida]